MCALANLRTPGMHVTVREGAFCSTSTPTVALGALRTPPPPEPAAAPMSRFLVIRSRRPSDTQSQLTPLGLPTQALDQIAKASNQINQPPPAHVRGLARARGRVPARKNATTPAQRTSEPHRCPLSATTHPSTRDTETCAVRCRASRRRARRRAPSHPRRARWDPAAAWTRRRELLLQEHASPRTAACPLHAARPLASSARPAARAAACPLHAGAQEQLLQEHARAASYLTSTR